MDENSSDHSEKSPMISNYRFNNPIFDGNLSQCSLEFDAANEVPMRSSISHENQADISNNETLNSQTKKQDPAAIGKQKIIRHPKIFLGTLMILILICAGIGIIVSQQQTTTLRPLNIMEVDNSENLDGKVLNNVLGSLKFH